MAAERFYTVEQLGQRQSTTPEGFLLCEDVPIARIGEQLYAAHELPFLEAASGIIRVQRDATEVFKPEAIASFAAKDVCNNHPPEEVNPSNYQAYTVGVVLNPRRGEGEYSNRVVADLLIKDRAAIAAVRAGKREVSAGYDAEYEQLGPGRARQYNIIGNHVALVEKGRCGTACVIGDHAMPRRRLLTSTAMTVDRTTIDRIRRAFKARDENEFEGALSDLPGAEEMDEGAGSGSGETHIHIHNGSNPPGSEKVAADAEEEQGGAGNSTEQEILERLTNLETVVARLAGAESAEGEGGEETGDGAEEGEAEEERRRREESKDNKTRDNKTKARVGDSTHLQATFADTIARAEILAPGISVPTFDAKVSARDTSETLCGLRRRALLKATEDKATADLMGELLAAKPDYAQMTCDQVMPAFLAASELVKARRTADYKPGMFRPGPAARQGGTTKGMTPAEMNKINREKYGYPVG